MTGVEMIAAERLRQVTVEGYRNPHDDEHNKGELAFAAACYAAPACIYVEQRLSYNQIRFVDPWPWLNIYDKRPRPSRGNYVEPEKATDDERISLLTKAGALIAAEIDRLHRKKEKADGSQAQTG